MKIHGLIVHNEKRKISHFKGVVQFSLYVKKSASDIHFEMISALRVAFIRISECILKDRAFLSSRLIMRVQVGGVIYRFVFLKRRVSL